MFWIPPLLFVLHMLEELPRFPAWATRHFGATSLPWYVYSHGVLVATCGSIGWWANASPPGGGGLGLAVHAGHDLSYHNVGPVAKIPNLEAVNIGFSIISRAVFTGLKAAVAEMRGLLNSRSK